MSEDNIHNEYASGYTNDVSMVDVNNHTQHASNSNSSSNDLIDSNESSQSIKDYIDELPPLRRKSIITDDIEFDKLNLAKDEQSKNQSIQESQNQNQQHENQNQNQNEDNQNQIEVVPTEIQWTQGGEKVYITGSFTGWRKMIGLTKIDSTTFSIKLSLPVGTHRFRFIVDNELRFSDHLPTATDQMGNFVNYIEILSPKSLILNESELEFQQSQIQSQFQNSQDDKYNKYRKNDSKLGLTNDEDDMGNGYSRYHVDTQSPNTSNTTYFQEIPAIFTDPLIMEQYYTTLESPNATQQQQWLIPPMLPPHLENVILNKFSHEDNNSGSLPIPNHVQLNHLSTTSIKHNVLAVGCVVRYKRKYVTQVLYAPLA